MTEENEELIISKSQVKREMQALRDLGEELVALPRVSLKKFSFPERLLDSILLAQDLKREALRRQIQHIGKLLREEDDEDIRQLLSQISQPQREEIRAFHEIEQWRDKLLNGDDEQVNQAMSRFPDADRQHLRQLVRNARKERQQEKPPKSARLLFQYLKELKK
ncbi:MAG: ribosome biogenesis factor YjgA [Pseudomonadota bacterium]|nr:ribosome biogenesis factor YjgA [Pseudomonadota bacterium]